MKGRPIEELVYEQMFPNPRPSDPQNFNAVLQRFLILEVRRETHNFYGHLDTPEAKYPGLDYTNPIHRIRLSRWMFHRRLFRAFDALRLTPAEISRLARWEGTKWAKERYEQEQGVRIRDTTADGFPNYADPDDPYAAPPQRAEAESDEADARAAPARRNAGAGRAEGEEEGGEEARAGQEESDGEMESLGASPNERLRERAALRNVSGDNSMSLDEEWENWIKFAIESGELPHVADQIARSPGNPHITLTAEDIFPPRMIVAARAGRWDEIPGFLHDMIRLALQPGQRPALMSVSLNPSPNPGPPARYANAPGAAPSRPALHAQDQRGSLAEAGQPQANNDRRAS